MSCWAYVTRQQPGQVAQKVLQALSSMLRPQLGTSITAQSNNLIVCVAKVCCFREGLAQNHTDADMFPNWYVRTAAWLLPLLLDQRSLQMLLLHLADRTKFFGRCLDLDVEAGCTQFVYLGAGLDSKLVRYSERHAMCAHSFFEIDLPHVISAKESLFRFWSRRRGGVQ